MTLTRPTLKDIAVALQLSHPTVSRALAGHAGISEDTKARVRQMAEQLGYVANSNARMLRRGQGHVVGLLLPDITNEFYAAVAQRLADDCGERGQQLLLSISAGHAEREHALVRALLEARPSGMVVSLAGKPRPATVAGLSGTTCVQFMHVHPEIKGPAVTVEDSSGARLAFEHLLKLGHRRIAFVGPTPTLGIGEARLRGVSQALQAARVELDHDLVRLGPSSAEFGFEAVESLLSLRKPPTALYLSTAPLSLGGARSLGTRQVRLPQDLSVVVAGSSSWYDAWPGGLTSITLPLEDLTDAVSDLMLQRPRKTPDKSPQVTRLSFRLVERGSTAAPPAA